jgi:hypothetical protein
MQAIRMPIIAAAKSSSSGGLLALITPYPPDEHDRPNQDQKHRQEINKEILWLALAMVTHSQGEIDNSGEIKINDFAHHGDSFCINEPRRV